MQRPERLFPPPAERGGEGDRRRPRGFREATDEEIAACARALAHAARVGLLRTLSRQPHIDQATLAREVGISQPCASKHLALLERTGFIHLERAGGAARYRLARPNLVRLRMVLARL